MAVDVRAMSHRWNTLCFKVYHCKKLDQGYPVLTIYPEFRLTHDWPMDSHDGWPIDYTVYRVPCNKKGAQWSLQSPDAIHSFCKVIAGRLLWDIVSSSTAQGGGGSFKNRKPIGEVGCCESRMAERSHWWTERWLRYLLFPSLSFCLFLWPSTYLPTYLSMHPSISLPLSLSLTLCRVVQCGVISVV